MNRSIPSCIGVSKLFVLARRGLHSRPSPSERLHDAMYKRLTSTLARSDDSFVTLAAESSGEDSLVSQSADRTGDTPPAGFLIVNADDWGRDTLTTNSILECSARRAVSSVSAMVFMEDSDRAAKLAREHDIEA